MKYRIFPKKDEAFFSTFTALIVVGLIYQGCFALWNIKSCTVLQKVTHVKK